MIQNQRMKKNNLKKILPIIYLVFCSNLIELVPSSRKSDISYSNLTRFVFKYKSSNKSTSSRPIFKRQNYASSSNGARFKRAMQSKEECHAKIFSHPISISRYCQEYNYTSVECEGYCFSDSLVWKNVTVDASSCCSFKDVVYQQERIYCSKQLSDKEIEDDFLYMVSDDEMFKMFKRSLLKNWIRLRKNNYAGYYTIKSYNDAKCACQ